MIIFFIYLKNQKKLTKIANSFKASQIFGINFASIRTLLLRYRIFSNKSLGAYLIFLILGFLEISDCLPAHATQNLYF